MSNHDQFDEMNEPMPCIVCEALCPEAVDGTLSAAEQHAFEKHVAGCVACAQEFAEAHRGAAWMTMLKGHTPEPPASLLTRILAETSGATSAAPAFLAEPFQEPAQEWLPQPIPVSRWATFRTKLSETFSMQQMSFQPRLAMTAAMAFFSIAMTLNLAGVRLTDLRADSFRPQTLRRSIADAGASATRSFQNLRVVYEVESRVSEARNNDLNTDDKPGSPFNNKPASSDRDTTPQQQPAQQPEQKPAKDVPPGKSDLEYPILHDTAMPTRKGV